MLAKIKVRDLISGSSSLSCKTDIMEVMKDRLDLELIVPSDDDIRGVWRIIYALDSPIRLRIIHVLSQSELPVCVLSAVLGIEQSLVSHHLSVLKKSGVVDVKTRGRYRLYYLVRSRLVDTILDMIKP